MFITITLNPAIDCTVTVTGKMRLGGVHQILSEHCTPGGKGVNVAKNIAGAGQQVIAGGILGVNELPEYTLFLRRLGVAVDFMTVEHPTRQNLMVTDTFGNELKLNRAGFNALEFDWDQLRDYALRLSRLGDIVILSGSLPSTFPANTYAKLIKLLKKAGKFTVLDTSGEPLKLGVAELPDIIKPNRAELVEMTGLPLKTAADLRDILRQLALKHKVVIMSDGAKGAWFASRDEVFFCQAPEVKTVDTTGAGDALLGRFCADYFASSGGSLTPKIMAQAIAAGSAAVEQPGTPAPDQARISDLASGAQVIPK